MPNLFSKKIILSLLIFLFAFSNIYSAADVHSLNNEGQELIKKEQYNEALNLFKKAIALKPDYWFSYRNAGWVLLNKLNNPVSAIDYLKKGVNLAPNEPLPLVELAQGYFAAKEYNQSVNTFIKSLELFKKRNEKPYGVWIYSFISNIYLNNLNEKDKALYYLLSALKIFKDDTDLLFNIANLYKTTYKFNDAVKYYNLALTYYKKQGKTPPVWLIINLSDIIFNKFNKHNEAINLVLNEESLFKNEPIFYLHLANMYLNDTKYTEAINYYKKSINMYKNKGGSPPQYALTNLAAIYLFKLNPAQDENAILYLNQVLNDINYEFSAKEFVIDWLSYAYIKTEKFTSFLELSDRYLNKLSDINVKKRLYNKLAQYYYEKEINIEKALNYAKLAGDDFDLTKILKPKKIELKYSFHIKEIMSKYIKWIKPGIIHITLPVEREYQEILDVKTSFPKYEVVYFDGLKYLKLDFSDQFPADLTITITLKLKLFLKKSFDFRIVENSNDPNYQYANQKTDYYDIDNPVLINAVNEITKNKITTDEKVRAVFKWVSKNITHWSVICQKEGISDIPENWPKFKKISEIYIARKGICNHISELFVGMMRILKIPARLIGGFVVGFTNNKAAAHVVAEIYDYKNMRWLFVEPQGFIPFGLNAWNHIIFNSNDIARKYPHAFLHIGTLEHIEKWNIGNNNAVTFSLSYID